MKEQKDFIIKYKSGGYLCRAKDNTWEKSINISKATTFTYDKAEHTLNNCFNELQREALEIINKNNIGDGFTETIFDEDGVDWNDISKMQNDLYRNLIQYRENMNLKLSEIDHEICDINHYIEFFNLDAAKGYKAYKMLKERLARRRFIKDEIAKSTYFLNSTSSDFSNGIVEKRINGLDNRQYTPRVLAELFNV